MSNLLFSSYHTHSRFKSSADAHASSPLHNPGAKRLISHGNCLLSKNFPFGGFFHFSLLYSLLSILDPQLVIPVSTIASSIWKLKFILFSLSSLLLSSLLGYGAGAVMTGSASYLVRSWRICWRYLNLTIEQRVNIATGTSYGRECNYSEYLLLRNNDQWSLFINTKSDLSPLWVDRQTVQGSKVTSFFLFPIIASVRGQWAAFYPEGWNKILIICASY